MWRNSGFIIDCAIIVALTTIALFLPSQLTKWTALFPSSRYEGNSTGGIFAKRLNIIFKDPIDYNDNGVAFLFVVGLVPLLSFAGTDLWESFSAAGVLNPGFGIIVGAPIGSLGMFKAGLKKLFPDQVKSIDWESMDVVGSRERFIKYKAFIADPCAIDPSRKFQSMVFKKGEETGAEWCPTTEKFEEIPGFKDRPQGEYLHANNDDLMHLGRYETVVTEETCDAFNYRLWGNGFYYTLVGWASIGITMIPVIACICGSKVLHRRPPELVAAVVWACLAFVYTPVSALTGFIAMRIKKSRRIKKRRRIQKRRWKYGGTDSEPLKKTDETETLITYWQPELEQYRTGTFYNQGPPRVQDGLYSGTFRTLTIIQGFLGVTTAIAAALATISVTNAIIAVISSGLPRHVKGGLAFGPFLIYPLRFAFVLPIAHTNMWAPRLSGQKKLSDVVLKALNPPNSGTNRKRNDCDDPWLLKVFLEPLRLSWLEGHRSVYQTTSHGGRWQHFPTQMVVEPTSSGGMRVVLPSACIVDGATLRNLIILLHRPYVDHKTLVPDVPYVPKDPDATDVTRGRRKPPWINLARWFLRVRTHKLICRWFMSILVRLGKPKWRPWLLRLEVIRPSSSYFLKFKGETPDGPWTEARAVRIPSEPWVSQDCARGALYVPDFATDTPKDDADPTRQICVRLQVPGRFVEQSLQPVCHTCRQAQDHDDQRTGQTILYRQKSSRPKGIYSLRTAGEAIVRHIGQSLPVWTDNEELKMTCLHALCDYKNQFILNDVPLPSQPHSNSSLELWIYQHCQHQRSKVMLRDIPDGLSLRESSAVTRWPGYDIAVVDPAVRAMDPRCEKPIRKRRKALLDTKKRQITRSDDRERGLLDIPSDDIRSLVLAAVEKNGSALQFASSVLREDQAIVTAAVKQNGLALQYAARSLQKNEYIVTKAVKQDGLALQYASQALQETKDVVTAAIKQNGLALQYAARSLQENKAIVTEAVKQEGLALQYASRALQETEDVAMEAVKQNGLALRYLSH